MKQESNTQIGRQNGCRTRRQESLSTQPRENPIAQRRLLTPSSALKHFVLVLVLGLAGPAMLASSHYQAVLSLDAQNNRTGAEGAPLIQANDGLLYGTTENGTNYGTVFRVRKDGTGYQIIYSFTGAADGGYPRSGVIEGNDGALYGTATQAGAGNYGTFFRLNKDGTGFRVLHSFSGYPNDGSHLDEETSSENELLQGSDGALYGITQQGGTYDLGTAYRLNKDGSGYTILHHFGQPIQADCPAYDWDYGQEPCGGLIEGSDGSLYGTALVGGQGGICDGPGGFNYWSSGVVFKMAKDGSGYTILHSFTAGLGASYLKATLIEGRDGALYGTADNFADQSCPYIDSGAVFRLNKDGSGYQVLHFFDASGDVPSHRLLQGDDGALYGTTGRGGTNDNGIVYTLGNDGTGYKVLYTFQHQPPYWEYYPARGLVKASDGDFYGSTVGPGGQVIYRISPSQTPDMLTVRKSGDAMQVVFSGASGYNYQLLRSTDLKTWSPFTTITMPASGFSTNLDNSPPTPKAFYRAAWLP
ncbi:MAG: hypothetical protein C5B50_21060 [Verrucomicrobia bacterium]|nr:MAG: hypothetical protein C5B50_21060 [Verrucomicrobiota bacterium]